MANISGPLTGLPTGTSDRSTTALLPVGTRFRGASAEWVYVKAGAAIAQYDAVVFNGSAAGYDDVRPVAAANTVVLGVADTAFASGDYGFVQTKGVCTCKVVVSTAAKSPLSPVATAGTLGIAVVGEMQGTPIVALVTGVAAGSAVVLL